MPNPNEMPDASKETSITPDEAPSPADNAAPPGQVKFSRAFWFWLKLGFISFGGPAGQIAIMHRELVERKRWISEGRFLHALNYCMVIPGPEAQQLATYIGWLMHRTSGGVIAGGLFVLPSALILIALSWVYVGFGHLPVVAGLFYGIKPAVTALVIHAIHRIGSRTLKNPYMWAIAVAAFASISLLNIPFPFVVLGAALIGVIGGRLRPSAFKNDSAGDKLKASYGPAIIDDDSPTPAHARFSKPRFFKLLIVGLLLWVAPMALLFVSFGWNGTLTQMAWFFTQAALVTFGGAYAVLPFVVQGATGLYGWLTPTQMIDGLALGETTPGPLIIIVTFVGFVGGWTKAVFGSGLLPLGAITAAIVVTWFTFLPSFLFIFIGGPFIESTKGSLRFTAPLKAITASVVGVIGSLSLFFAYHVFLPRGFSGSLDIPAICLAVAAAVALIAFKRNPIEVIVASALIGMGLHFIL